MWNIFSSVIVVTGDGGGGVIIGCSDGDADLG